MRVLALAAVLAACASLPVRPERPRTAVREGRWELSPDGGVVVELAVDVANPNPRELSLRALDWELSVEERPIARGRTAIEATIAARASTPVTLEARVGPGRGARVLSLRAQGATELRLDGVLHFVSAGGDVASTVEWVTPPASAAR